MAYVFAVWSCDGRGQPSVAGAMRRPTSKTPSPLWLAAAAAKVCSIYMGSFGRQTVLLLRDRLGTNGTASRFFPPANRRR